MQKPAPASVKVRLGWIVTDSSGFPPQPNNQPSKPNPLLQHQYILLFKLRSSRLREIGKFWLDFRVGTKLPPRSGGPAAGARSALRRAAPEARARVSKRRISSLSFCTLLHFPSLTPLEFSPIRLKMTSFGEHDQQKVHISHSGAKHALIDRARGRRFRDVGRTTRVGTCIHT